MDEPESGRVRSAAEDARRDVEAASPMRHVVAHDVAHVYAHFPFCARKCPYCDFNSHAGRESEIVAYTEALLKEARHRLPGTGVRTLYVGGGTPTHADPDVLERYLAGLVDATGGVSEEFTVEANPGTVDAARVRALVRAGVGRVSIGAQSFDAEHLRTLGRIHDAPATRQSVDLLRDGGIERISVDLILSVPHQTPGEQARDLSSAISLEPQHISAYVLTIEAGTAFDAEVRTGRMARPDEDRDLTHLRIAVAQLAGAGYGRYEVSNFARPGEESQHNLAYWRDADWVGLGAGAHSHVRDRRWENLKDPRQYSRAVEDEGEAIVWVERAPPKVRVFEAMMMGLRLVEGVDLDALGSRIGFDPHPIWDEVLERHVRDGLLIREGGRLRATPRGLELLAYVLRDLVVEGDVERFDVRTTRA